MATNRTKSGRGKSGRSSKRDDALEALFAEAVGSTESKRSAPARGSAPKSKATPPSARRPRAAAPAELEVEIDLDSMADAEQSIHLQMDETISEELGFDDLERELQNALGDEDDPDDDELRDEIEKLIADSFGSNISALEAEIRSSDDLDDEIFAVGDEGPPQAMQASAVDDAARKALEEKVRVLQGRLSSNEAQLRSARDEVATLEARYQALQRRSAQISREFDSFRRRSEREREDQRRFAAEKVLKEFLGVFDNLERALAHAGAEASSGLGMGVQMTLQQFLAALRRHAVERVESSPGSPFDPSYHEAVGQEHSADIAAGAILSEMQAGFTLHGRLLRASMVTVSRGPAAPVEDEEPPADDVATGVDTDLLAPVADDEPPAATADDADGGA